jgi:hypothetical protein
MIGLGVNFSSETKNIEDWIAEELGWKREGVFQVSGEWYLEAASAFVSTTLETSDLSITHKSAYWMQNRALAQKPPTPKGEYIVGRQENLPFCRRSIVFYFPKMYSPLGVGGC